MNEIQYMVIRKRDDAPAEIYTFIDSEKANKLYESMSENWTECYLCQVLKPLR